MIFLPTVFSAPSPGPESEAPRTITRPSLYTNSCVLPLLFAAEGARLRILPAPRGLGRRFQAQLAGLGEQGQQSPQIGSFQVGSQTPGPVIQPPPLFPHPSEPWFSPTSLIAFTNTQRGKELGSAASHFRLSEIICPAEEPHGMDSVPQRVVTSMRGHVSAPSTPHYHQGPTNALHPGVAARWPDSEPTVMR